MRFIGSSLLVLASCDGVFGLPRITTRPDAPAPDVLITDALTCWAPQQVRYDSDQDGYPNGCDNCPGDHNESQSDDDLDGVGDACDPHRGASGDHLAFFDGFEERDSLWLGRGVSFEWAHMDGAWAQLTSSASTNAHLVYDRMFRSPTVIVTHEGQLDLATLSFGAAYVWMFDGPGIPPEGLAGGTRSMAGARNASILEIMNTTGARQMNSPQMLPAQDPARVMVLPTGKVIARRGNGLDVTAQIATIQSPPAMTKIALQVYGTPIRFTSVTVIEQY